VFVEFEWDPSKTALNEAKHGIGFAEARALWEDPGLIILPSRFPDEPRHLAIGMIAGNTTQPYSRNAEAVSASSASAAPAITKE